MDLTCSLAPALTLARLDCRQEMVLYMRGRLKSQNTHRTFLRLLASGVGADENSPAFGAAEILLEEANGKGTQKFFNGHTFVRIANNLTDEVNGLFSSYAARKVDLLYNYTKREVTSLRQIGGLQSRTLSALMSTLVENGTIAKVRWRLAGCFAGASLTPHFCSKQDQSRAIEAAASSTIEVRMSLDTTEGAAGP